jgi:hypothetical protein
MVLLELDLSIGIDQVPPECLDLLLQALYLVLLKSLPTIVFVWSYLSLLGAWS